MCRKVLIGLDGVPYGLLKDFMDRGVMPHTASILKRGNLCRITSSIPEISSTSWSSIITGSNPGEHGIYGFTGLAPNSYLTIFPNFENIKKAPFWLNEDFTPKMNKRFALLNIPATYPAKPVNGIHISGFVALDLENAVYPRDMLSELGKYGYAIDVDAFLAHESMSLFFKNLDKTLDARIESAKKIWEKEYWDVFMLVFTGTDRLGHFLWDAYEDKEHEFHDDFLNHFRKIDCYIGELYSELDEGDTIAFVSDHGIEKLNYELHINRYLYEWGYLKLKNFPGKSYGDIDKGTTAFCMDPGRVYLNYEGRYPRGCVKEEEAEEIITELCGRFEAIQLDGASVVKQIFLGKDVFSGPDCGFAPDIVLIGAEGFDLKGSVKSAEFHTKNIFTGKHSYHDAFFGIHSPGRDKYPELSSVYDVRAALDL